MIEDFWLIVLTEENEDETEIYERERHQQTGG